MASISKNLERAVGRSINIPTGTDLIALLYTMGSEDRYYTPDITRLTNTNGLPVVSTWYNFTCDDLDPTNKRIYASHAQGYHYVATITNSGISKWALEFSDNTYPIGIPIPFPGTTPPLGYALCNGQSFNTTSYPKLATVYPTGVIPDLRGEFIRGWDNGRGVDASRALLSFQDEMFKSHGHTDQGASLRFGGQPTGLSPGTSGSIFAKVYAHTNDGYSFVSSRADGSWGVGGGGLTSNSTGGAETRPRNVAYNYIVRMA